MPGERDLNTLLRTMRPELQAGVFVFSSLPNEIDIPAVVRPLLWFREREGVTVVIQCDEAERAGLSYQFASRLITLSVHSALDAVGFLAAVTTRLGEAGISVNAVSAFHHDHLFVPEHRADEALQLLLEMSLGPASG